MAIGISIAGRAGARIRLTRSPQPSIGAAEGEPPLRAELFGLSQLESHAVSVATQHAAQAGRGPEMLLRRLSENDRIIQESHRIVAESVRQGRHIAPAAEWLLDNFHLIEEQVNLARAHLSPSYSRELPRLRSGPLKGFPRVYDLALELVSHTDGCVDIENLAFFVKSYQGRQPLTLGELWAIPIMMRLTLIENLRRVAYRIAWRRGQRDAAQAWVQRFFKVVQEAPRTFVTELADFVRSRPALTRPFIAELSSNLDGVNPTLGLAINWIEQELAERGQTIEMIQQSESQDQAADQVSIGNSITSLRGLGAIDWPEFVETLSATDSALRRDPVGVYPHMDFRTRDRYRHVIEALARRCGQPEPAVAEAAVSLAAERRHAAGEQRVCHVGYYLIDAGRTDLEERMGCRTPLSRRLGRWLAPRALHCYVAVVALFTGWMAACLIVPLSTWWRGHWGYLALTAAIMLIAVSRPAILLVNWLATLLVPPRPLAKLDFAREIPPEHRTLVVVPTFLRSAESVKRQLERMEVCFLANHVPNLHFALLTDFPDAPRETMPGDAEALAAAVAGIRDINAKYDAEGRAAFFLLHRPRRWNAAEGVWMGYERKRGKLAQLNGLIREGHAGAFSTAEGDVGVLQRVRYVITLDSDTQMPAGSAAKMAGAMAHPLNRPKINPASRCVRQGYGVLQPRLATSLLGAGQSLFARLFAGEVGIDPYTREVSNIYHDLFGEGQFVGKGIYDVEAFHAVTGRRFPENRILSHDLIEGCHARCGFLSDVELIEENPSRYLADVNRRHRWTRGDWQIARWLLPTVPGPDGKPVKNWLSRRARWMIFDNLRRSVTAAALLAAFAIGWLALPAAPLAWTLSLFVILFLPGMARSARSLLAKGRNIGWPTHLRHALKAELRQWAIDLLSLAFVPYECVVYLDAVVRAVWRLSVSRRGLLEWRTAADAEWTGSATLATTLREMWSAPVLAAAVTAAVEGVNRGRWGCSLPVAAVWFASPSVAWWLSRQRKDRQVPLTPGQRAVLRALARRTWAYFERFVGPDRHWLPPDNFQEKPVSTVVERTSPTNIGLGLLSGLAAWDFGYVTGHRLLECTQQTLDTMEKMERYRGHFYNWYSTETLQPLHPFYVSSVDSGNLSGHLAVLREGLLEMERLPVIPASWRRGVEDTARVLREEVDKLIGAEGGRSETTDLVAIREAVARETASLPEAASALPEIHRAVCRFAEVAVALEPAAAAREAIALWLGALRRQCEDLRDELGFLAPWLECGAGGAGGGALAAAVDGSLPAAVVAELSKVVSLQELATLARRLEGSLEECARLPGVSAATVEALRACVETAGERADRRIMALHLTAGRCDELGETDIRFLYDYSRHLLSIGFDLEHHRLDSGYYDLLASEARLCSFVAVARGNLPVEHWFRLGRQLAAGDGPPVLVSWSGSLFEYLMPLLVMPSFDGTLLAETYRGAVQRQMRYGREQGIPWGFSESGYNQVDVHMLYQYRAFGVPSLGLKRGLAEDLVVAPYAAVLALMVAPKEAFRNLEDIVRNTRMGRFGAYEAVDYTPARLQTDERFAVVESYMAHHSGMSLLALDYVLNGRPMQRRFAADRQMQSSMLLLQERIPLARSTARSGAAVAETADRRRQAESREFVSRTYSTADTPVPEVHLLSNGRYHVMITNAGGGFSRWQDLDLTRWREDVTQDNRGFFLYLKEVESGAVWSPVHQPVCAALARYEATFSQGVAEFRSARQHYDMHLRIAVSPEDDVELRQLIVTNTSNRQRAIEVTSFAEAVLLDGRAESGHPAFHRMFLQPETVSAKAALVFTRRRRSPGEEWPCLFHSIVVQGGRLEGGASFETDRAVFVGRGRTPRNPAALDLSGPLAGRGGTVLDPAAAIRHRIRLAPGESATINAVLGVGENRETAGTLIDRYRDHRMAERVFELAWTHSQVLLHQIRASEADAQVFARLAGAVLYASPQRRRNASVITRNRKNQSALWSYWISGDLPVVLLRMSDQANMELVRKLIQAHAYWRHKGLQTDLVIWAEAYAGYRQSLLDAIIGIVQAGTEAKALDQPAGIFVRNIDQVPEEDRMLFQAAARIVLSDRHGSLSDQLERRFPSESEMPPMWQVRAEERPAPADMETARRDLTLFNGRGGFTADGREYVMFVRPADPTPAPWVNVLANSGLGSVVTESGGAYTWCQNAHLFRLTPWHNDPVSDVSGEAYYVRDEATGRFWSPTPAPAGGQAPYVCRHGHGYSAFEHTQEGIFTEMFVYVAADAPLKFAALTLRNLSDTRRRLSVTGYCEWVLGESRERHAMHVVTRLDPQTGAILAWNAFNVDFGRRPAFFQCSAVDRTVTADRTEFIGRNGWLAAPAAMRRGKLSGRIGAGFDPCGAMQAYVEIPPRGEARVVFTLGAADNEQEARRLLRQHGGVDGARQALEAVWQFWKHTLGGVYVETPDLSVNYLVSHWLLYQALTSRFWGRSGYYQSGGAYGFRDQLQDALAFLYEWPDLTRQHLLVCAGRQFREGDFQHWWHPPTGRGLRTRISDDSLWLPFATCRYVEVTGDTGILDESIPFLEGRALADGEESAYDLPQVSERRDTLYGHCQAAIRGSLRFGSDGLPLMGAGDWNDGMNRVGAGGKGESVWLGFFFYRALRDFARLAERRGDRDFAALCGGAAGDLQRSLEAKGWDGQWYLRAIFDDGTPLGSASNPECRIDSLPQSWAVLSGAADPLRAKSALQSVLDRLVDPKLRLIRLLDPPFDAAPWDPGYIKGYPPGLRENGGQYTHAAVWVAMAFAELREPEKAWEMFRLLNPIRHADSKDSVEVYQVEPYVVAADVYTAAGLEGRGGWTWYTGSAGWMYQLLVEHLLGLKREVDTLSLAPLFPPEWDEFTIHYRHRRTFYHIRVRKTGPETWKPRRVLVDNAEQPDQRIHLVDDGAEHAVFVEAG